MDKECTQAGHKRRYNKDHHIYEMMFISLIRENANNKKIQQQLGKKQDFH